LSRFDKSCLDSWSQRALSDEKTGYVYYLYEKTHSLIKIGYTRLRIQKRFQDIESKLLFHYGTNILLAPPNLEVLHEEACRHPRKRESELHQKFDHLRPHFLEHTIHPNYRHISNIVGRVWGKEWFEASPEIFDHISELREITANE